MAESNNAGAAVGIAARSTTPTIATGASVGGGGLIAGREVLPAAIDGAERTARGGGAARNAAPSRRPNRAGTGLAIVPGEARLAGSSPRTCMAIRFSGEADGGGEFGSLIPDPAGVCSVHGGNDIDIGRHYAVGRLRRLAGGPMLAQKRCHFLISLAALSGCGGECLVPF